MLLISESLFASTALFFWALVEGCRRPSSYARTAPHPMHLDSDTEVHLCVSVCKALLRRSGDAASRSVGPSGRVCSRFLHAHHRDLQLSPKKCRILSAAAGAASAPQLRPAVLWSASRDVRARGFVANWEHWEHCGSMEREIREGFRSSPKLGPLMWNLSCKASHVEPQRKPIAEGEIPRSWRGDEPSTDPGIPRKKTWLYPGTVEVRGGGSNLVTKGRSPDEAAQNLILENLAAPVE